MGLPSLSSLGGVGVASAAGSALTNLISGKGKKVQIIRENKTVIEIDCTTQETHSRESPPTEFELEDGGTVSDHIILKQQALEIQGIITDTPISVINSALTAVASHFIPPIGIVAAGVGMALFNALKKSESPSVQAYAQLLKLQEERKPFDVLTTLNRYDSMVIKSISVPRDAATGQTLVFTLQLVKLKIVKPQTVNIGKYNNSDLSPEELNGGKQEAEPGSVTQFKQGQKYLRKTVGQGG
jgi:hypothetical protein